MISVKGYAAQAPKEKLGEWTFERREVGPDDIQFDIQYCGVCHSDLHQVNNDWFPGIFPMVPGHEIVGTIVKVGSNVKKFRVGDLAAVGCLVGSCKHCENCDHDLEQYCLNAPVFTYNSNDKEGNPTYGGYSKSMVVNQEFGLKLTDKLSLPAVAPLLCAGITTYSPLRKWKVGKGHKLAVLGLGGLGHMAVKFGVAFGAEVTVLSTSPKKEADAKKLGAHKFVPTSDAKKVEEVKGYFDFILDTVSAPHDFDFYLGMLKTDGTHICVGVPADSIKVAPFSVIAGRKSIAGSSIGGIAETQEMLDYCAANNIVSDIELVDIKDIQTAFHRMEKGDVRYRFVIDMATL